MKCVCPMGGDRTCPDDCPHAKWESLSAKERNQKTRRQPIVTKLADEGYTQQRIATMLGVSQKTISKDLVNYTPGINHKKGAGRPQGSKKPRAKITDQHEVRIISLSDAGRSATEISTEVGIHPRVVGRLLQDENIRREARAEPEIDRADLSMTAQQKLDAAIRQHKRKLDMEFSERCSQEVRRRLDEVQLPHYKKELETLERSIRSRKGFMDRTTYRKILACLHPDWVPDPARKKRYEDAFALFTELERHVLDDKESPYPFKKMPSTYEELMAMKAKVQAERRAKRAAKVAVR